MKRFNRRETLLTGLFGAGYVGLRAMATGLPAWFLTNPRKASAQDMTCALSAMGKVQFLVVSASSAGDSISCNCPGTYTNSTIIHPTDASMAATSFTLGSATVTAAAPWATLTAAVRNRTNFFHHTTGATVHGDHPKVMRLLGATAGNEMLPSIYAKHLAKCLGTVQAEPVAVGTAGNALEMISFSGRTLPTITPTQLKQLLTGSKTDPVVKLRTLRDTTLDELNALFKDDGTPEQKRVPRRDGGEPDAGAAARAEPGDDARVDHRQRRARAGAGGGGADRRQGHAGRHAAHPVRRRQPHRRGSRRRVVRPHRPRRRPDAACPASRR